MSDDLEDEDAMKRRFQSNLASTDGKPPRKSLTSGNRITGWAGAAKRGALIGFGVGLLASGVALAVVWRCLPFYITYPPSPWPWYCTEPAYPLIGFLAFPVNLLTGDLAQAIPLAPVCWLFYSVAGALIGAVPGWLGLRRTSRV